jgi:hypothetical protein
MQMKSVDVALLQNCHQAVVTVVVDTYAVTVRIRPAVVNGKKVIYAIMVDPQHTLEFTDLKPHLGLNPTIQLMQGLCEPEPPMKERLHKLFKEIGMVFISPADQKEAITNTVH